MVLATELKAYRRRLGLTQAALGRALGVTSQMVSLLEQGGRVVPSTRLLQRIVNLLDLNGPTVKAAMLALGKGPAKRGSHV